MPRVNGRPKKNRQHKLPLASTLLVPGASSFIVEGQHVTEVMLPTEIPRYSRRRK